MLLITRKWSKVTKNVLTLGLNYITTIDILGEISSNAILPKTTTQGRILENTQTSPSHSLKFI